MGDFFFSKERTKLITPLRATYFAIAVVAFLGTEFGRKIYRPFIYSHGIEDYGLADMIGNLGGTVVQIFLYLGLANSTRIQGLRIITIVTVGYLVYEFLQPVLPRGTFDWLDVYATLVAGSFSAVLMLVLHFVLSKRAGEAASASSESDSEAT